MSDKLLLGAQACTSRMAAGTVVDDVAIDVAPGEIVGLLGPNGAGKTTTFYMVVGLTSPDSGQVFLGEDEITEPADVRARPAWHQLSAPGALGIPARCP